MPSEPNIPEEQEYVNISTLYRCTGRSFTNSIQKQRQLLLPLNNLGKRILQKYREPTILKNSRLGFIESILRQYHTLVL